MHVIETSIPSVLPSDPILNGDSCAAAELTFPQLPLHVQQQPLREEEKESCKNKDEGEVSPVDNGMCSVCVHVYFAFTAVMDV